MLLGENMSITATEAIQGLALEVISKGLISNKKDAITMLSEGRQVETDKLTHKQIVGKDGNVLSSVDINGDVTLDADLAKLQDRSFGEHKWEFPGEHRIVLEITHARMHEYGLANTMFYKVLTTGKDIANFNASTEALNKEFTRLLRKVRTYRRGQVKELLANLEAPSHDWQKPMGYNPVDVEANRPNYYKYTNKLSAAALDAEEFALAVDILAADQVNLFNEEFEMDSPQMLLHAKSYTLAEKIFAPAEATNVDTRRAGNTLGDARFVGVYKDSTAVADWIILGENAQIFRMNFKGVNSKNGIQVEIHPAHNRTYGVELVAIHRSIMVCQSPLSIIKCVAP